MTPTIIINVPHNMSDTDLLKMIRAAQGLADVFQQAVAVRQPFEPMSEDDDAPDRTMEGST